MVASNKTQTLTDFRQSPMKTLNRLNRTGEPEVLTVDGEARAILMAPAKYDEFRRELLLARDVANIRESRAQLVRGDWRPAGEFFSELREKLHSMKRPRARKKRK